MTAKTVVVAHRATMMAEGLAAALARFRGIVPVGIATSCAEADRRAGAADAVVLDQYLPGANRTAIRLRRRGIRVVMLGAAGDDEEGLRVPSSAPVASLAAAILPQAQEPRALPRLTAREQEVLALVATGLAGKQVARQLGISPKTVEQHKTRIFSKLGVRNQTAAVSVALGSSAAMSAAAPARLAAVEHAEPGEDAVGVFPGYRDIAATSSV